MDTELLLMALDESACRMWHKGQHKFGTLSTRDRGANHIHSADAYLVLDGMLKSVYFTIFDIEEIHIVWELFQDPHDELRTYSKRVAVLLMFDIYTRFEGV